MNIPGNSFITLVEYPEPDKIRVTWQSIDGPGTATMIYTTEAEAERVHVIVKDQHDLVRETPPGERAEALRALAKARL